MNFLKRKQKEPTYPKSPEPPKDDSITSLETYARDKLIYDMHILNNFLESLYKEPKHQWDKNYSRDERWVKICNSHIGYVQDVLNSNYGDGATKKCKYCDKVFKGYMAGAMLEYHNNSMHKDKLEEERKENMLSIGMIGIAIFKTIAGNLTNIDSDVHDKE